MAIRNVKSKKLIYAFAFGLAFVLIFAVLGYKNTNNLPPSVIVDAGNPLTCNLLEIPKQIEDLTAQYSCIAPGAYLASVDTDSMIADYFTTNSQGDTVTFGPESVIVLEINQ